MSQSKQILKEQFVEHFLFDYTDKDEFEVQMLSEIFEGIYYQKDKHFKPESKYWQVFRCLKSQQAKIYGLKNQLSRIGYVDNGGQLMKPPVGNTPNFDLLDHKQAQIDDLQKLVDGALFKMRQQSLMLREDMDGHKDPVELCQSEGVDMCVRILEKALRGEYE